jgi:hypothetical protein
MVRSGPLNGSLGDSYWRTIGGIAVADRVDSWGRVTYGKTKRGECMSEKEAVQKGYRPANGTGDGTGPSCTACWTN